MDSRIDREVCRQVNRAVLVERKFDARIYRNLGCLIARHSRHHVERLGRLECPRPADRSIREPDRESVEASRLEWLGWPDRGLHLASAGQYPDIDWPPDRDPLSP